MKKIFSSDFKRQIKETIIRFPFTLIYSFSISIILVILVSSKAGEKDYLYKVCNALFSGIIFSILATILSETLNNKKSIIYNLIVLSIFVLYYFFFPIDGPYKYIYKTIVIDLSGILAIIFSPFLSKNKHDEFWFYNSKIVFNFIITSIYTAIIIAGVSIAFGIINSLIGTKIESEIYLDFGLLTIGIFSAIFFLSIFPKNFNQNLDNFQYPKTIKFLVFYILLPLTTIYFVILYLYFFKIIIQWHIPEGSVAYMILIFSVLGIFALTSIIPLKNSGKYKAVTIFAKSFFLAILPLIVLLFVSIFIRIKNFGITENRFYVIVFAIWLAGISIYMIITKLKDFKIIPISLFFVLIISGFGPWSAFNISKISQLSRLDKILNDNKITPSLEIKVAKKLDIKIYDDISDISDYLINNHGIKILEKKYNLNLSSDTLAIYELNKFISTLNIYSDNAYLNENYFSIYNNSEIIDVSNYDYFIQNFYSYSEKNISDSIHINYNETNYTLTLKIDKNTYNYNLKKDLINLIKLKMKNDSLSAKNYEIILPRKGDVSIKIILNNFSGNFKNNEITNSSLSFSILLKFKE